VKGPLAVGCREKNENKQGAIASKGHDESRLFGHYTRERGEALSLSLFLVIAKIGHIVVAWREFFMAAGCGISM